MPFRRRHLNLSLGLHGEIADGQTEEQEFRRVRLAPDTFPDSPCSDWRSKDVPTGRTPLCELQAVWRRVAIEAHIVLLVLRNPEVHKVLLLIPRETDRAHIGRRRFRRREVVRCFRSPPI